ncbi:MAG: ABC transporter ATP-binding protein [Fibrobacteria bacterium]|nr:ABC transporter ATP-binding protein [Fibrobacteria bacterium]
MPDVINFCNVNFSYTSKQGPVKALNDINFQLPEGAVLGLLGPNGAGKTTLIRCITGLLVPDEGTIQVLGSQPGRSILSDMGVLIENPGIYRKMNAMEYLSFFGRLYGLVRIRERVENLYSELNFSPGSGAIGNLSVGQKQMLQIIRSLLHTPRLLLWDEPFSNLDPMYQQKCMEFLQQYIIKHSATALIATHQLYQAESLCTHFGFIKQGILSFSGSREKLEKTVSSVTDLEVQLGCPFEKSKLENILAPLGYSFEVGTITDYPTAEGERDNASGETLTHFALSGEGLDKRAPELIRVFCAAGMELAAVVPRKKNIHKVYEELVSR